MNLMCIKSFSRFTNCKPLVLTLLLISFLSAQEQSFSKLEIGELNSAYVRSFARAGNVVFYGTTTGLFQKDENGINRVSGFENLYVTDLLYIGDDRLFVSSYSGVFVYDLINKKMKAHFAKNAGQSFTVSSRGGLSSDSTTSLAIQDHLLYIGTERWGINILDLEKEVLLSKKITSLDGLPSDTVWDLHTTPSLLIAATEGGPAWLWREEDLWNVPPEGHPADQVKSRQVSFFHGDIFVATTGEGVIHFDPFIPENNESYVQADGALAADFVMSLAGDGRYLWVSTLDGVSRLDWNSGEWKLFPSFTAEFLDKVYVDGKTVLVGTDGSGVFTYTKKPLQISVFPQVHYEKSQLVIKGKIFGEENLKAENLKIEYRDAEIGGAYTSSGVSVNNTISTSGLYSELAYVNFKDSPFSFERLWDFEFRLSYIGESGNYTTARFPYDSKPPEIQLLGIPQNRQIFTRENNFELKGRVSDSQLDELSLSYNGEKQRLKQDNFGNFTTVLGLRPGSNRAELMALDNSGNSNVEKVLLVRDNDLPLIPDLPSSFSLESGENTLSFSYSELSLKQALLEIEDVSVPVRGIIEPFNKQVSFILSAPETVQSAKLVLVDEAGNRNTYDLFLKKDERRARLSFTKGSQNIETASDTALIEIEISGPGPFDIDFTQAGENQVFTFDEADSIFRAQLALPQALTLYELAVTAGSGLVSTRQIAVSSSFFDSRTGDGEGLQSRAELLSELEKLKGQLAGQASGPQSKQGSVQTSKLAGNEKSFREADRSSPALWLAKVPNGQSVEDFVLQTLGSPKRLELVYRMNKSIPGFRFDNGTLVMPNQALIIFLERGQDPIYLELLEFLSECLYVKRTEEDLVRLLQRRYEPYRDNISIQTEGKAVYIKNKVYQEDRRQLKQQVKITPGETVIQIERI